MSVFDLHRPSTPRTPSPAQTPAQEEGGAGCWISQVLSLQDGNVGSFLNFFVPPSAFISGLESTASSLVTRRPLRLPRRRIPDGRSTAGMTLFSLKREQQKRSIFDCYRATATMNPVVYCRCVYLLHWGLVKIPCQLGSEYRLLIFSHSESRPGSCSVSSDAIRMEGASGQDGEAVAAVPRRASLGQSGGEAAEGGGRRGRQEVCGLSCARSTRLPPSPVAGLKSSEPKTNR